MLPNLESIGKWLVIIGFGVVILGGIIWGIGKIFGWERFPGTLRFQTGNLTCIIPILASIILSILLTVILNIFARFNGR